MAGRSRLRGDRNFRKILKQLPSSAQDEMGDILEASGIELLAEMRRDVPVASGALKAGLSSKLLRKTLRLRVGLIGTPRGRAKLFYGFIVELGRKARTVTIKRGPQAGARMRVRQMAARPFVWKKRVAERGRLNERVRGFWGATLADAAQGVGSDD